MTGQRIEFRPAFPRGAVAVLVLGSLLLIGAALGRSWGLFGAALPCLTIGVSLLLVRGRSFTVEVKSDGLVIDGGRQRVAFGSILEVRPQASPGRPRPSAFGIEVIHRLGRLELPARASLPSERIYVFLRGLLEQRPRVWALTPGLEAFRREQVAAFGEQRVTVFSPRAAVRRRGSESVRGVSWGLAAAALGWLGVALVLRDEAAWWITAVFALFGAAVGIVAESGERSRLIAVEPGGLVVAPTALALERVGMKGLLKWGEIKDVNICTTRSAVSVGRRRLPAIDIEVDGATVSITESYDRGLAEIYEKLLEYWRR